MVREGGAWYCLSFLSKLCLKRLEFGERWVGRKTDLCIPPDDLFSKPRFHEGAVVSGPAIEEGLLVDGETCGERVLVELIDGEEGGGV